MEWAVTIIVGAVIALCLRELLGLRRCGVDRLRNGAVAELAADVPRPDRAVREELQLAIEPQSEVTSPGSPVRAMDAATGPAAVAGSVAALSGALDWWDVDQAVLDAVAQWTHTSIDNVLDLWSAVNARRYAIGSFHFEVKLRGHVGEHQIAAQLEDWAGPDRFDMPDASNHPGYDFTLDGFEANAKMGQSVSVIREHLREHPNIPVIVNADMEGLPADALTIDLSQPFDPELLADHSIIVADGLLLSDLDGAMADALGPALGGLEVGDLTDGLGDGVLPGVGAAIRVVVSGRRQHQLLRFHGDRSRAIRSTLTDASLTGGGAAVGGGIGSGVGAVVDVLSLGTTMGLGTTVIGPAVGSLIGAVVGGKAAEKKALEPLQRARKETERAVVRYGEVVDEATARAHAEWNEHIVPDAERRAETQVLELTETAEAVRGRAESDLQRLEEEEVGLADQARQRVAALAARYRWHLLARRRIIAWQEAAEDPRASRLELIRASPGGQQFVVEHLHHTAGRRAEILAAVGAASARLQRLAARQRSALLDELARRKEQLELDIRQAVEPECETVRRHAETVRHELVATGAATVEWVEEHFPETPDAQSGKE